MILLKLLIIALLLPVGEEKWIRVETDQHVSFLFPNTPQKIEKNVDGIPTVIYQTKDLVCVAGIVCSDMTSKNYPPDKATAALLYEEMKKSTLSMGNVTLRNEISVPDENMLIKEIEYTIIKDKNEMTYFKRFIFRNNYIYQITIGARNRFMDMLKTEKEIFFNSITFT